MIQEDKDLLIKDLCARLSYNVKIETLDGPQIFDIRWLSINMCNIANPYLPYLFPLSSLTKEQRNIISNKIKEIQINNPPFGKIHDSGTDNLLNNITLCAQWLINYYIENHFDYNGLIEKGLAINAQDYPNIYNDYDK
jgi:hypothetical protein